MNKSLDFDQKNAEYGKNKGRLAVSQNIRKN